MEDKYKIKLRVVEDELVNYDEFLAEFDFRVKQKLYPIVIKIDEGPDLKFLKMVNNLKLTDWVKSKQNHEKIFIETDNLVQPDYEINHIKNFNELPFFFYKNLPSQNKKFYRKFMLFVGAHRWPRFILSDFFYKNFRDQSYLSYWQTVFPIGDLKKYLHLNEIKEFAKVLPLYVESDETIERHITGYINFTDTLPLFKFYNASFLDCILPFSF